MFKACWLSSFWLPDFGHCFLFFIFILRVLTSSYQLDKSQYEDSVTQKEYTLSVLGVFPLLSSVFLPKEKKKKRKETPVFRKLLGNFFVKMFFPLILKICLEFVLFLVWFCDLNSIERRKNELKLERKTKGHQRRCKNRRKMRPDYIAQVLT